MINKIIKNKIINSLNGEWALARINVETENERTFYESYNVILSLDFVDVDKRVDILNVTFDNLKVATEYANKMLNYFNKNMKLFNTLDVFDEVIIY